MYEVKSCGIKLKPCLLLITYIDKSNHKLRCRKIPLRNFKINSKIGEFSEELKRNQRHKALLQDVPLLQIEKMLLIVQSCLKGNSLEDAIAFAEKELTVDPNKDLNKLDKGQIDKAKQIMDQTFHEKQIKSNDPNFEYDVEVEFDQPVGTSAWDSDEIEEF